jgi:glutamate racemase
VKGPIGIFDSGYGGLTVLKEIQSVLPDCDYLYFGDNARAPYGTRSFDVVYQYTLQAVQKLFEMGCPLVVLACNTASAKALRTIQQHDLPNMADPSKRVLGVIRPSAEVIGNYTKSGHVGVLGTNGTVKSNSYSVEIEKFFPEVKVTQLACPMWVPLVENNEYDSKPGRALVKTKIEELIDLDPKIDTIVLGCTHYPILKEIIEQYVSPETNVLSQGEIVAHSLKDYFERHPEMKSRISTLCTTSYFTTENPLDFEGKASIFLGSDIKAQHMDI